MVESQPQVDTLNSSYFGGKPRKSQESFHIFARLPAELRLRIWNISLPQPRLLTVSLCRRKPTTEEKTQLEDDKAVSRSAKDRLYRVALQYRQSFSPLLWVNGESRIIALGHYRIRIPTVSGRTTGHHLYLNPDQDYLYIRSFPGSSLPHFLNALKAYDARKIGLRRLALWSGTCNDMLAMKDGLDHLSSTEKDSFKKVLRSLWSLWIVHLLTDNARIMLGILSGTRSDIGFNRSVPVFPKAAQFELFDTDPRPIAPDMRKVSIGRNPHPAMQAWEDLERKLGVAEAQRKAEYVVAVSAVEDYNLSMIKPVQGRKSFQTYLREEESVWEHWEEKLPALKQKRQNSETLSAAGFWVFPTDTFDNLPLDQSSKHVLDMKGHQPALGLFRL